jgi:DNA-binding NarL/FixJ family response regulator
MADKISSKIQVMIIEDDDNYRESIQSLISESGKMDCKYAVESCEEAIEILDKDYVAEVILLDIKLPGISGIEGIRKIKAISPSTHIIILTDFDDDDKIFNAICLGASGYLLKSASIQKIEEAVENVLCGGAVMTPSIAAKVLQMFGQYSQPKQDYGLTQREKEILQLLIDGMSKKYIAEQLYISPYTIDTHLKNIYAKLHVHSQVDMIAKTLKEHLL